MTVDRTAVSWIPFPANLFLWVWAHCPSPFFNLERFLLSFEFWSALHWQSQRLASMSEGFYVDHPFTCRESSTSQQVWHSYVLWAHVTTTFISRSMETPKIAELWQALRASGLECLAPTLVQLRVRSLDDVTCRVTELSDAGVLQWQIEAIIAARGKEEHQRLETSAGRSDHPTPFAGRRASLAAALEAAQPNNRKRSLGYFGCRHLSEVNHSIAREQGPHL